MTRYILPVVLLMFALGVVWADGMSVSSFNNPLTVADSEIMGIYETATPTLTIAAAATQASILPAAAYVAGAKVLYMKARGGAVHYGPSTVLSTANGDWPILASGSTVAINVNPSRGKPAIYFFPAATGTEGLVRFNWGK